MIEFDLIIILSGNGAVLYLFTVTKDLKTPTNNLVVNLALSDFLMMLTRCPIFVYNSFNGGVWHQGPLMCEIYGSVGGVFGITSISTMTAIALDRYNVIVRGMNGPRLTNGTYISAVTLFTVPCRQCGL